MIQELQRVKANFDFARYTFNRQGNYQFYNAPIGKAEQWQNKEKNNDGQTDVSWISKIANSAEYLCGLARIVRYSFGNCWKF